ncbi:MAG: hypothetical protein HDP34_04660 [Clostridia bacterium]|nr:hypothetical protein [Clostridia bacterium]
MKKYLTKTIFFNFAFILFLVYTIILFILTISTIVALSDANIESYYSYPYEVFNIKISTLLGSIFQFLTTLLITTIFGYFAIKSSILLYKEYKMEYSDKIAARKAARAEADKQAKIAKLEAELEELKKDE